MRVGTARRNLTRPRSLVVSSLHDIRAKGQRRRARLGPIGSHFATILDNTVERNWSVDTECSATFHNLCIIFQQPPTGTSTCIVVPTRKELVTYGRF